RSFLSDNDQESPLIPEEIAQHPEAKLLERYQEVMAEPLLLERFASKLGLHELLDLTTRSASDPELGIFERWLLAEGDIRRALGSQLAVAIWGESPDGAQMGRELSDTRTGAAIRIAMDHPRY